MIYELDNYLLLNALINQQ